MLALLVPLMSHAIAVGETVMEYVRDINGFYLTQNYSWTTTDDRLSLEPSGYSCNITCTGYFSGTQRVRVSFQYKLYYGDSWHTTSRGWTFDCAKNPVYIHPSEMELTVGETGKVTYSHKYHINYPSAVKTGYFSEMASIATVNDDGIVTGIAEGSTYIVCTSNTTDEASYCKVTVKDNGIKVSNITLNQTALLLKKGDGFSLNPTIYPEDAKNKNLKWTSTNEKLVTVDDNGVVNVIADGGASYLMNSNATIICEAEDGGGAKAECYITVPDSRGWFLYNSSDNVSFLLEVLDYNEKTCQTVSPYYTNNYKGMINIPSEVLGYKVTKIGKMSFYNCKMDSVVIPNTVTEIDSMSFEYCQSLKFVSIPRTVLRIGRYAFLGCVSLNEVSETEQLQYIGGDAFLGTPWIEAHKDKPLYIGKVLYSFKNVPMNTTINVKEGTKCIANNDFNDQTSISLVGISIPSSVDYIERNPFEYCYYLKQIDVDPDNSVYDSREDCNAIIDKATSTLVVASNSTYIPNSVKHIGGHAFGSLRIKRLVIPDGVETIGARAVDCNLDTLIIGRGVVKIDEQAFAFNPNMSTIISCIENPMSINSNVFYSSYSEDSLSIYNTATLYVPIGSKVKYESTDGWNKFKNIVEVEVSGINFIKKCNKNEDGIYDLQGRKLIRPRKGINIVGRKKIIVK